jgi:hypothetical protein
VAPARAKNLIIEQGPEVKGVPAGVLVQALRRFGCQWGKSHGVGKRRDVLDLQPA